VSATNSSAGGPGNVPRPRTPAHILIVDNLSRDGWTWAGALRRAGYRVGVAADTDAGWHALDNDSYALLITSEDPTGRTGLDLIRKVRSVPDDFPCLLIREKTASDVGEVARLLEPGAALAKPVSIALLLSTVRELLRCGESGRGAPVTT